MTAYRVLKNTERAGNVLLGAGCYAAVLQHRTNRNKVIKIGNTATDAWGGYFDDVISALPDNPHVPRVDSMYVDYQSDYYVANMERLQSIMCDDFDADDEDFNYSLKEELATDIHEYIMGEIKWKHFKRTWKEYPQIVDLKSIRVLMDKIIEQTDAFTEDDEEDLRRNYHEEELLEHRKIDIHSNNIMFRGNAVVITDPWCGLFIEDHQSMDEYIDNPDRSNHEFNLTCWGTE